VLSLTTGGKTRTLSGTSMSAAHASGVIALGLSVSNGLGPVGRDIGLPQTQQGQGLIDALLTVQNVEAAESTMVASIQSTSQQADSLIASTANMRRSRATNISPQVTYPETPRLPPQVNPVAQRFATLDRLMGLAESTRIDDGHVQLDRFLDELLEEAN
jgi:hypothetical protein